MIESSARWAVENVADNVRRQRDYLGQLILPRQLRAAQPDLVQALKHLREAARFLEAAEKAIKP